MQTAKRLFIISILMFTNSYLIYSQVSTKELLIKREIETLRQQAEFEEARSKASIKSETSIDNFSEDLFKYTPQRKLTTLDPQGLKYFGYAFFTTSMERQIWNNLPPQSGYILGAGEEVIIEIWGDTQMRAVHIIDQYGKINVDKIGQVHLAGTTLKDAENKLLTKFQNVHSSLKGDQPTSFIDISIGKLKSINVTLLGETGLPGIHAIHPFSTIITGLMQTGGVLETGSLRSIQLIRNGQTLSVLDFYQYLLNANTDNDLRLLDGDIIFIPVRHSTISLEGEIVRKGKYELVVDETIEDLIQFAGGFAPKAQNEIRINRLYKMQEFVQDNRYNETIYIDYLTNSDYIMKDGDAVMIYEIVPSKNEIFIYGQVQKPGSYSFNTIDEMTLLDLLILAGGFNDSTYLKTIYLNNGEIIRSLPGTTHPQIINFDIKSLLNGNSDQNIILQNWDIVLIRQNPNFRSPNKVSMMGEVKVPGIYTIQKKWETLDDIIKRSGGFTNQAFEGGIQMYRNEEQVALKNFDIVLLNGDSLFVPLHPGVVQILGAVNRPGIVQYDKKKSLNEYIATAGGFAPEADKNNISIVYANGDVKTKKLFIDPKVGEGATIIVQYKDQEEPFDLTGFATNMASIITSIATLSILINQ